MTERRDPRAERTKRAIRDAIASLVDEKPFQEITVTDLAGRAHINRKTFYVYYDNLDDWVARTERELMLRYAPLMSRMDFFSPGFTTRSFFRVAAPLVLEDIDTFTILHRAGLLPHTLDVIKAAFIDNFMHHFGGDGKATPEEYRVFAEFAGAGLLATIAWWVQYPGGITPQRYCDMIARVATASFTALRGEPWVKGEARRGAEDGD